MIFRRTSKERDLWRGWLESGQAVELSRSRSGWEFGAGVHVHSNDDDQGDRLLFLKMWRFTIVIPMGIIHRQFDVGDEPQWSAYASSEFGLIFHWGQRRASFDWPWDWYTLAYEEQKMDGSWGPIEYESPNVRLEHHPYTYALRSGEVQHRVATVSKRRHVLTWRALKPFGWPRRVRESIDVKFDDEVGERSGSWKGGCIGCGYDLRAGETMLDCLRRMERERKF